MITLVSEAQRTYAFAHRVFRDSLTTLLDLVSRRSSRLRGNQVQALENVRHLFTPFACLRFVRPFDLQPARNGSTFDWRYFHISSIYGGTKLVRISAHASHT
jgi:hypothetical protein